MNTRNSEKTRSVYLILALISSFTFIAMTKDAFSSAMVFIVKEGLLTKAQTGTLTAVFYLVYALLQFTGGVLADRWKPDLLITVGYLGAGVANLVIWQNHNYVVMLITWSLCAVIQAPVWPSLFKLITTRTVPEHQGTGLYLSAYATPGGNMLSFFVASLLPRWEHLFLLSGIGLIAIGIMWELLRRQLCPPLAQSAPKKKNDPLKHHALDKLPHALFFAVISLLLLMGLVRGTFDTGIKGLIPTMISDSYGDLAPSFATILNVIVILAGILGIFLSHYIYPSRFKTPTSALFTLITLSIVPTSLLLTIGRAHYAVIVLMLSLISLLMCGAALMINYVSSYFNHWNLGGTVSGLTNCVSALGIVIANLVFPKTSEAIGWIGTIRIWIVMIVLAAVVSFALMVVWKRFMKKTARSILLK